MPAPPSAHVVHALLRSPEPRWPCILDKPPYHKMPVGHLMLVTILLSMRVRPINHLSSKGNGSGSRIMVVCVGKCTRAMLCMGGSRHGKEKYGLVRPMEARHRAGLSDV